MYGFSYKLYLLAFLLLNIIDNTLFPFCYAEIIPTKSAIVHHRQVHAQPTGMAYQRRKRFVVTITSNYVVTQTDTSYSFTPTTSTISRPPSPPSSSAPANNTSSKDTPILIGSLVGGIAGLALIGIGLFLLLRRKDHQKHAPPANLYIDQEAKDTDDSNRSSYPRAFVPPLHQPAAMSTPTTLTASSERLQQYPSASYHHNVSDPLIYSYHTPSDEAFPDTSQDRHVPDEVEPQSPRIERHVPNLVD